MKKSNKENFIDKAKKIHGNKYNYSKVEYIDSKTKVCIICPEYGEFWQTPCSHLQGRGCKKCATNRNSNLRKYTLETFIKKAKQIHNNKYDYSKVEYIDSITKVCIICPEHGEFWQTPNAHLKGSGCPSCCGTLKYNQMEFIEKLNQIHKYKYDYSKVEYKNLKEKICIICPEHGEFWQKAGNHLRGDGCRKCVGKKLQKYFSLTTEQFIEKAKKAHGDKYDYSKVEYVNSSTKVCIICPEHGEFWQTPSKHLVKHGCLACKYSHLENDIYQLLKKENINFIYEWHNKAIEKKSVDFFLPDYNIAIECQGRQHFIPINFFGGNNSLNKVIQRDENKYDELTSIGIKVIYYTKEKNIPNFLKEKYYYYNTIGKVKEKLIDLINER